MITVVREMAHRVATELAHMETAAPRRGRHRRGAERGAGRGARAGARGGAGVGGARSGAAAGAARARRRGRRRLRRDAADRGRRSPACAATHDELPEVAHHAVALQPHGPDHESSRYRYCTNFVVSGGGLRAGRTYVSAARGASATRCWSSATARRCACTSTPTSPSSAVAVFDRAGTVERLDVADMHEQQEQRAARLAGRRRRRRAVAEVRCGVVAVAAGRGHAAPVRAARRARGRGRVDAQPEHLRDARRHPRGRRRRGRRAAEQRQRDPGGRARRRAVGEGRRGGRVALAAGRARVPRRARPATPALEENAQRLRDALDGIRDRRGRAGRARRQAGPLQRRATRSASWTRRSWPGATPQATLRAVLEQLGRGTARS